MDNKMAGILYCINDREPHLPFPNPTENEFMFLHNVAIVLSPVGYYLQSIKQDIRSCRQQRKCGLHSKSLNSFFTLMCLFSAKPKFVISGTYFYTVRGGVELLLRLCGFGQACLGSGMHWEHFLHFCTLMPVLYCTCW